MPGITATMVREIFNCSVRAGLYAPVRDMLTTYTGGVEGKDDTSLLQRILAALVTGTIGAVISNPVDVVKGASAPANGCGGSASPENCGHVVFFPLY